MKIRTHYTQTVIVGMLSGRHAIDVKHEQELAAPMTYQARRTAYHQQNGGRPLTARQQRQLDRMSRRGAYKAAS